MSPAFAIGIDSSNESSAENVLPLSLKRAVEIALAPEGSPRIELAQESIELAQEQSRETKSALLPDLESSVNEERETVNLKAFGFNFNFPTIAGLTFAIPTIVGPFSVFDARATVSQTVVDLSAIKRYHASKVNTEAVKADYDTAKNQVSDQVARAYLTGLRAEAAKETAQANVDLSNALLKLAEQQLEAGTGTGIEVVRARVQLANDQQHLIVAQNDLRKAGLNLLRAMGLKLETPVQLIDKLAYKPTEIGTMDDAITAARKMRAELKAQTNREEYARMSYGATRAERLPSLGASANYGGIGTDPSAVLATYEYGVSLRIPLFDGGRRDARRAEALTQYHQEQTRMRDLEQQVDLDVRLAFDSVHSAETEVQTAQEGMQLSEQELAQARRRYAAGVANGVEVTDAQNRLARARDNEIAALYDYNVARIDLATATGTIREYVNQ